MALHELIYVVTVLALLNQESESQLSACGRPRLNSRIVGGQAAPAGSWPWQVSLHHFSSHFCGGSLINNLWVLSAAHCFSRISQSDLTVFLGRQRQVGSNPDEVSRTVSQIIRHPDYNADTSDNDIALLRLSSSVTFTDFIAPVCLAASNSTFFSGIDTWVTGWGNIGSEVSLPFPQNLMEVQVPIVGNRRCKCNYGVNTITNNMVCAGLAQGGKDSCQGDSGGPLVSKQGGRWIQAGIVSFGRGCAEPNFPGVYARVSQYETWINNQIKSNQPGFISFTSTGTDGDLSVSCPGLPAITTTTTTATTTTTTTTTATTTTTTTTTAATTTAATRPNTSLPPKTTTTTTTTAATTSPPQSTTPKPVVCGRAPLNSRILGGSSVATAGEWPWMASLQKNGRHMCGGTLVAVDSVMSNANCFSGSPVASEWTVVLGRLKQNGSNPFEVSLNVTNITLSNLTGSNIAVLKLSTQPTLTDYIQPICLDNGRTFAVGLTCWIAGWSSGQGGEEQVLQEFQTSILNCGNASTADSICTGLFTLEQGDSGDPLMCTSDGSWFQTAVLSFVGTSTRQKREDAVMVFEKLTRFQTFLIESLGRLLSPTSNTATTASATLSTMMTTSGSTPVDSSFLLSLHLLVLSLCLQLFS